MPHATVIVFHICAGVIGLSSGLLSMLFRKGSSGHRLAGNIFFVSMLSMSFTGAFVSAFIKPVPINVVAGSLTFYLVVTAWIAARRREMKTNWLDVVAMLAAIAIGLRGWLYGVQATRSAMMYFLFGSIAMLFAAGDLRMLLRGGVSGARRIARHLWRMCFALLIALTSLYPGQAKLFPESWRQSNVLYAPLILLIVSMFYWLIRVRFSKAYKAKAPVPALAEEVSS